MEFLILTGMSGAGKGTAGQILEDMGYLCVDNMPFSLIETCIELYKSKAIHVALGIAHLQNLICYYIDIFSHFIY